jgi:hypothetical protein
LKFLKSTCLFEKLRFHEHLVFHEILHPTVPRFKATWLEVTSSYCDWCGMLTLKPARSFFRGAETEKLVRAALVKAGARA